MRAGFARNGGSGGRTALRRLAWALTAVGVVGANAAVAGATTPSGAESSHGHRIVFAGSPPLPTRHATSSLNWSGYVVRAGRRPVVATRAEFVVPAVASPVPPGFASTWAGIGGFSTGDLIQAGVQEQTVGNPLTGPQYSAWYELLPDSSTPLTGCRGHRPGCAVAPGDRIRIVIRKTAANRWLIAMTDVGHWAWSKTVRYRSSGSSAEWVTEAPTLVAAQTVIANLDTVRFDGRNTFTPAGLTARTIGHGRPTRVVLGFSGAAAEAVPSALDSDGDGFNVCTYASTCAAPPS